MGLHNYRRAGPARIGHGGLAQLLVLLLVAASVSGQFPSTTSPTQNSSSGSCTASDPSVLTPIMDVVSRVVVGGNDGHTLEEVADTYSCTAMRVLQPFGLFVSTTNVSLHPASDSLLGTNPPGYSSVDVRFTTSMLSNATSLVLPSGESFSPSTVALATTYVLSEMKKLNFTLSAAILLWTRFRGDRSKLPTLSSEDFRNVMQVTGPNLLPFTIQKQTIILAMLQQRFLAVAAGKSYVGSLNISAAWNHTWPSPGPSVAPSARAGPGAAPSSGGSVGSRRSLRQVDRTVPQQSLGVELWTGVSPTGANTPSKLFASVLGSELEASLADAGLPVSIRFINSTIYTREANGTQVAVTYDPPLSTPPSLSTPAAAPNGAALSPSGTATQNSSSHSSRRGAIIGATLGALAAVVIAGLLVVLIMRRRRRHRDSAEAMQPAASGPAAKKPAALKSWELSPAELRLCRLPGGEEFILGYGNFGRVVKGMRNGVQEVAVKIMNRQDTGAVEEITREIAMMKLVSRDRNIVQFYGACRSPAEDTLWMVVEFMEGGDLRNALTRDRVGVLRWYAQGKSVALDITRGLVFLHSRNVTHRDLKSKNILLSKDGTAKIADVGMAKITAEGYFTRDNALGTFAWAAPELLLGDRCTEKVDIFSLGVCLWELCTQEMPQRGLLRPPEVPGECPQELVDIIDACMQRDAKLRPSALEVYQMLKSCPPNTPGSSPTKEKDSLAPEFDSAATHLGHSKLAQEDSSPPGAKSALRSVIANDDSANAEGPVREDVLPLDDSANV